MNKTLMFAKSTTAILHKLAPGFEWTADLGEYLPVYNDPSRVKLDKPVSAA